MKLFLAMGVGFLAGLTATAQTAPALAVDATASVHPISPYVYGINEWGDDGLMNLMRFPLIRWGGDDATAYNWQTDIRCVLRTILPAPASIRSATRTWPPAP
jgi:hypothetical protein